MAGAAASRVPVRDWKLKCWAKYLTQAASFADLEKRSTRRRIWRQCADVRLVKYFRGGDLPEGGSERWRRRLCLKMRCWTVSAPNRSSLGSYIENLQIGRELSPKGGVSTYKNRTLASENTRRTRFSISGRNLRVHILIRPSFPFSAPRIALANLQELLGVAAPQKDGVV